MYIVAYGSWGPEWSGTGSFVRKDLVATAGHVCDETKTTLVQTHDGVWHSAKVVVVYDEPDVCLLKTEKPAAPETLRLAKSSRLEVGAAVWYWGYPSGSPGIFYGHYTGHRGEGDSRMLLAAVNGWFGSSGSLLMRADGRVVGVLSQTRTGNGVVLAFAPVEALRAALAEYDEDCGCSRDPNDLLPVSLLPIWF